MSKNNDSQVTGHEYDGIEEYDNPLPSWWLATFLLSIIFSFLYYIHYEFGGGMTQPQELAADMNAIKALEKKDGGGGGESETNWAKLAASDEVKSQGKLVFESKCSVCHGPELQGGIGPNLVDDYWLHGKGTLPEIAGIIRTGVTDKGMPSWESLLKDAEVKALAAYIDSKRGSQPANAKAPQGEKVVRN